MSGEAMTGDAFDPPIEWLRAKRGVKWHRPGADTLPAWVADMDFPVAEPIVEAIRAVVDRGDLGYPDWPGHPLAHAFAARMEARHGWAPDPGHVRGITDLIQALQLVLHLATEPGDGVIAHVPNYPPFLATLSTMHRPLLAAPISAQGDTWRWDAERLRRDAARGRARVLLLVNPHNPSGRAFTRAELEQFAALADELDLLVVSDEIHAELVHDPARHIPFASLSPATARRTVTVTSATKAFNIAGLRTAVAHVGPPELRRRWDAEPPDLYGAVNVLGVEATLAAWRDGDDWLARLQAHLADRRDRVGKWVDGTDGVEWRPPEAGYLAWLDCAGLALPAPAGEWFRRHAAVELSAGPEFGPGNEGCVRLNFATSGAVLDEILARMTAALERR